MIHISDLVRKLDFFLQSKEEKYKIFIRINFSIDVYVFTTNINLARNYQNEFIQSLKHPTDTTFSIDDFYMKHYDALKIKFYVVDREASEDDPFYTNMLSDEDTVDWGPRYRFDSLLRKKTTNQADKSSKKPTPVVTFYSYKGGMGRTTTMVAYALSLATNSDLSKRKRVVIVDCDLEAPGYLNFFDLSEHNGLKSGKKNGLVEFISDAQLTNKPQDLDINDYIINVGLDNESSFAYKNLDNIWIVPAGNLNEGYSDFEGGADRNDYLEGLAKINLSSVQSVVKYFNLLFDKIKETLNPDIILIDSRTGFNDIFGTAALYLSSCVVGFFGFSRQTQPGLINLLKEYYKENNSFTLLLIFSILPENAQEEWMNKHKQKVMQYINYVGGETKDFPSFLKLHRNSILERIGTGDDKSDSAFVKLVQSKQFNDYNLIFDKINERFFKNDTTFPYTSNTPAIQLRNIVLKHLKDALANVSNFAEDTQINEEQFFYRECMKELFNQKKFLIQGYKGTGKTYLYKALDDKEIALNIQAWAEREKHDRLEPVFVNILPANESSLVFDNINYSGIKEPEYYFNVFWQIYTWNVLLLRPEFECVKVQSELADFIKPIDGPGYAKEAFVRIDQMVNDMGVKALISIEKDIAKLNDYLTTNGKRLFVLYDRLDTCINPLRWNKAVSPLINYWRNNCESYSNISPKIFVRTDLFKLIEGTNTARLENSIIHIEWSIGEVFGFFFKLIFSDKSASHAYWAIAEKVNIDKNYIINTKKSFERFPKNQFKSLTVAEMAPIIKVFFGNIVKVGVVTLGTPWEYFEKELANADNTAISLRPFINTLNSNAVDKALAKTEKHVQNGIISPEIYASKAVRDDATEKYFADLTQDAFSKDLLRFKEVIRTSVGERFRFKSLTESQYEELISITFSRITDSEVVKSQEDLKRLIAANGIMAEKITTKGRFFIFAPIYWYSWGLVNSTLEREEKKKNNKVEKNRNLSDGETYEGKIVEIKDKYGRYKKRIQCLNYPNNLEIRGELLNDLYEDDQVSFVAHKEAHKLNPSKSFWYATDVTVKDNDESNS